MKSKFCNGRVLGALLAFGALNTAALFAQRIDTGMLAAPAQSASQAQDTAQNNQSSPDTPAANNGSGNGQGKGRSAWQQESGRIRKLMDDLNMTDDQRQQVRTILRNHRQRIMAIRRDTSLSQDDKNQKLKAIRADARTKFQAILTPEQKQKLKEIAAQWKKDHPHKPSENTGGNAGSSSTNNASSQNVKSGYTPSGPAGPDDDDPASVLIGGDDDTDTSSAK